MPDTRCANDNGTNHPNLKQKWLKLEVQTVQFTSWLQTTYLPEGATVPQSFMWYASVNSMRLVSGGIQTSRLTIDDGTLQQCETQQLSNTATCTRSLTEILKYATHTRSVSGPLSRCTVWVMLKWSSSSTMVTYGYPSTSWRNSLKIAVIRRCVIRSDTSSLMASIFPSELKYRFGFTSVTKTNYTVTFLIQVRAHEHTASVCTYMVRNSKTHTTGLWTHDISGT